MSPVDHVREAVSAYPVLCVVMSFILGVVIGILS